MKKICKICQGEIDTNKSDYAKLEDYSGKKLNSIGFYHKKCFFEKITSKVKEVGIMNKAAEMLMRAEKKMVEVGI